MRSLCLAMLSCALASAFVPPVLAQASRVGQYTYLANLDGCVSRSNLSVSAGAVWGPVLLSINTCDSVDFNNDGSLFDPTDIDAFLSVFSEGPCVPAPAACNDVDFNNDGSLFDPCDIDALLLAFSEGPCTLCGQ